VYGLLAKLVVLIFAGDFLLMMSAGVEADAGIGVGVHLMLVTVWRR
jgi:hypothetical protein